MFYSPKKDIDRYVAIKNNQIKTLKDQIDTEKITQESVENAKKRLDKLKDQYNQLASQNYNGFAINIRKNQEKKYMLKQEILLKQKQLNLKRNQQSDVAGMKKQILQKIKRTKQKIQSQKNKQIQNKKQRDQLDSKINNLSKLTQKLRHQASDINDLQSSAKKQLNDCKGRVNMQQQKCKNIQQQMNQTGVRILSQKQRINQINHDCGIQQTKIQNLQLKIQNTLYMKTILQQQKQKLQLQKLMSKQRTQLNRHQNVSDQMMKILVKISQAMKQSKQKQKQNCQREIQQKLIELELSQCVNNQLQQSVNEIKDKIDHKEKKINKIVAQVDKVLLKDLDIVTMVIGQEKHKNQQKNSPFKNIDANANKQANLTPLKHSSPKQKHHNSHHTYTDDVENENLHVIHF